MARTPHHGEDEIVAYHGEVWTNTGGYATVELPSDAALLTMLEYELRDLDPQSRARVTGELQDCRFTIQTEESHVKVAWRISGRRAAGQPPHRQEEEG